MSIQESGTKFHTEVGAIADFEAGPIPVQQKDFCIQAVWAGTCGGTIELFASVNGTTYSAIPSTSKTILNSGSEIWNMTSQSYPYIKAVVTVTSGTISLGAWITSKD